MTTWTIRIRHIVQHTRLAIGFVDEMSLEDFRQDPKTILAVVSCITTIGEATRHIPKAVQEGNPKVPWRVMREMRNMLVHEYDRIDTQVVWDTVKFNLPDLLEVLDQFLSENDLSDS